MVSCLLKNLTRKIKGDIIWCFDASVVVKFFLSQLICIFPLCLGMVIYANKFQTKEKQKLNDIKY